MSMKYSIENSYGEIIGKARSIKDARYQVEQHIQNGLAEKHSETCRTIRLIGEAIVSDITFGSLYFINQAD